MTARFSFCPAVVVGQKENDMRMTGVLLSMGVGCVLLTLRAKAETEVVDGVQWTYTTIKKGAVVGAGSWYVSAIDNTMQGRVVVPETLGGFPVVAIGDGAFYRCAGLTEVTLPVSVTELGTQAFYHCDSLKALIFLGDEPSVGYTCFTYSPNIIVYRSRERMWQTEFKGEWGAVTIMVVDGLNSVSEIIEQKTFDGRCSLFAIPHSWVDGFPEILQSAGGDYSLAVKIIGQNGCALVDSYVAGLEPTDPKSTFKTRIDFKDGKPVVTWEPALNGLDENGHCKKTGVRTYRVLGSTDMKTWSEVNDREESRCNFFKVNVEMP